MHALRSHFGHRSLLVLLPANYPRKLTLHGIVMDSKLMGTIRCPSHAPYILCLFQSNPGLLDHASSKLKVISILPRRPPPYAFRENLEGGTGTAAGVCLLSTGPGMPGAAAAGGLNGVETGPFRP